MIRNPGATVILLQLLLHMSENVEVLERPTGSQITISNNSLRAYGTLAYFSFLLMLSSLPSNVTEQSPRLSEGN